MRVSAINASENTMHAVSAKTAPMTEHARRVRSCAAANRLRRAELSHAVSARATRRRAMRRATRTGRPIYRENDNPFRGGRVA